MFSSNCKYRQVNLFSSSCTHCSADWLSLSRILLSGSPISRVQHHVTFAFALVTPRADAALIQSMSTVQTIVAHAFLRTYFAFLLPVPQKV